MENKNKNISIEDPDLRIRDELLGLHSIQPWVLCCSSPRSLMMSSHLSQIVTIEGGEPQIIQTGLETQLSENTMSCKLEHDSRVIAFLRRYNGLSAGSVDSASEHVAIVQNLDTNELDAVIIPRYNKLHQTFGFKYKLNEEVFTPLNINNVLPKDTIFADSPTVSKDKEYKFGVPATIAYLHIPEVTGDGVVISEDLAKKFKFRTYETIVAEFGEGSFPLNLYGDDDNYKPFPDIGEAVNDDRVVIATRDYDAMLSPVLVSKSGVKNYSVYFDKPFYAKATGAKIVDIKVYRNAKSRKSTYAKTTDQVDRYADALKSYYMNIIRVYEEQNREHYARYREDIPVSESLHRLLVDAYAITESKRNVRYTYKNDLVDMYRVELTLEYSTIPNEQGFKVTTLHGVILCSCNL